MVTAMTETQPPYASEYVSALKKYFGPVVTYRRLGKFGIQNHPQYNEDAYHFKCVVPGRAVGEEVSIWCQTESWDKFAEIFESPVAGGCSTSRFHAWSLLSKRYMFYEEIKPHLPTRLYFDCDYKWTSPHQRSRALLERCSEFRRVFSAKLAEILNTYLENTVDFLSEMTIADASDAVKFSMHVVLPLYFHPQHMAVEQFHHFMKFIAQQLNKSLIAHGLPGFVDCGVYNRYRCMRTIYSTKPHQTRFLHAVAPPQLALQRYFIQPLPSLAAATAFTYEAYMIKPKPGLIDIRPTRTPATPRQPLGDRPCTTDADKEVQDLLRTKLPQAELYPTCMEAGVKYGFFHNGAACVFGKIHASNNGFLTVERTSDGKIGLLQVGCYSQRCSGMTVVVSARPRTWQVLFEPEEEIAGPCYIQRIPGLEVDLPYLTTDDGELHPEVREFMAHKTVLFVQSATGTGKTTLLKHLIEKSDPNALVTAVSVRQSFARDAANRLNLDCYLNFKPHELVKKKRVIVQLDSLWKVDPPDQIRVRDLLILDEATAILSHLFSPTLRYKQSMILNRLEAMITNAKRVIVLCADMLPVVPAFFRHLHGDKVDGQWGYLQNKYIPADREVIIVRHPEEIDRRIKKAIDEGKNVAFCSDRPKEVMRMQQEVNAERDVQVYTSTITGKYHTDSERKQLFTNLARLGEASFFGYTSTMTVGVDINFSHFHELFVSINNSPLCAREVAQMIARVRQLQDKRITIYCSQSHPTDLSEAPSSERISDALLSITDFEDTDVFAKALQEYCLTLQMSSPFDLHTGERQVPPRMLMLATAFTEERIHSMMNMQAELSRIFRTKGYSLMIDRRAEDGEGREVAMEIVEQEYALRVSSAAVDWQRDTAATTEEELYQDRKRKIVELLGCREAAITPEVVSHFDETNFSEEEQHNFVLMAKLSRCGSPSAVDAKLAMDRVEILAGMKPSSASADGNNNNVQPYTGPILSCHPEIVAGHKAEILYHLLCIVCGFQFGILDTSRVTTTCATTAARSFLRNEERRLQLAVTLQTWFKLSKTPTLKRGFVQTLSTCLRRFCGVEIASIKEGSKRCYEIDTEKRDFYLEQLYSSAVNKHNETGAAEWKGLCELAGIQEFKWCTVTGVEAPNKRRRLSP